MKNYLIFAMILVTGLTAYPQATRTAKESKSEKSGNRTETVHRKTERTDNKAATRSATTERSKAASASPERTRTRVETRSTERPQAATRTYERPQSTTRTYERPQAQSRTTERPQSAVRTTERPQTTRSTNPGARSDNQGARRSVETVRPSGNTNRPGGTTGTSSATRTYREGNGTLTREDGTVIRHQNDEIFRSRKFRLDFDNYENLRRSDEFRRYHRDYNNWYGHRHVRIVNHYYNNYYPLAWEIRRARYYHRMPHHIDLIWTPLLFHRFMFYYPTHLDWNIEFGSQIETISAYEAQNYAGTVRQVYGKVEEVFYSPEDENYILYIGGPFPYQDMSVVIPREIARNISLSPKWYFENEYVWVIGLINIWEGKPEIIVRDEDQLRKY